MTDTYLKKSIDRSGEKPQFDAEAKALLADKNILARIIKETVIEAKEMTYDEIYQSIGNDIKISAEPVEPDDITETLNTENIIHNEGKVTFDIKFNLYLKSTNETIKLIIDVEAQKDFNPGYELVPRGLFYCARMLSSQLDSEFTTDNYDNIKKVYSIWICMNPPKGAENSIFSYDIKENQLYGNKTEKFRSDILSTVMVCLPKTRKKEKALVNMLKVLFDGSINVAERENILETEYDLKMSREGKEHLVKMCNLSDWIEEQAIEKGIKKGIEQGREEGIEQGREEGREQGREEGRKQGREEGREQGREEGREEGREQGREEGRKQGREEGREKTIITLYTLYLEGYIDEKVMIEKAGMEKEEFYEKLDKLEKENKIEINRMPIKGQSR